MARTVADAVTLLMGMTGVDPADRTTSASRTRLGRDYTRSLDAGALRGARIGVARKRYFGYHPATDALIEQALADMKAKGAVIVDPADVPTADRLDACEMPVLLHEFKSDLNAYLAARGPTTKVRTLEELIAFNERERARELPYFGQELFIQAQRTRGVSAAAYRTALESCRRLSRAEGIDAVMKRFRLDALVAPTGSPAWKTDLVNGDHFLGASSTPAAVAGYPSITVPAGFIQGLPVGMSFIGGAWSEPRLIALAYAYEQATNHRRSPEFRER
jgi:amidase